MKISPTCSPVKTVLWFVAGQESQLTNGMLKEEDNETSGLLAVSLSLTPYWVIMTRRVMKGGMRFCTSCLKSRSARLLCTWAVLSDHPRGQVALWPFMRFPAAVKQNINVQHVFVWNQTVSEVLWCLKGWLWCQNLSVDYKHGVFLSNYSFKLSLVDYVYINFPLQKMYFLKWPRHNDQLCHLSLRQQNQTFSPSQSQKTGLINHDNP